MLLLVLYPGAELVFSSAGSSAQWIISEMVQFLGLSPTPIVYNLPRGATYTYLQFSVAGNGQYLAKTHLRSISQAITFLTLSRSLTVIFPVPGPISSTTSVDLKAAFSTMLCITRGFFRMCCPKFLLKRMPEKNNYPM